MKESFGTRFQRLRKNKGLTQEDVANEVNITPQSVSKWENDLSSPDISILGDLAKLLGVSVDELLGNDTLPETKYIPEEERKDINKMLLKIIVDSKDGDKVKINIPVAMIKILTDGGLISMGGEKTEALKNIDFNQIYSLIEQGLMGKLVEVESADGDTVIICVE